MGLELRWGQGLGGVGFRVGTGPRLRDPVAGKGSTAGGGLGVQGSEVRPWVGVQRWGLGSAQLEGASEGGGSGP